jgi:hypothetical protein
MMEGTASCSWDDGSMLAMSRAAWLSRWSVSPLPLHHLSSGSSGTCLKPPSPFGWQVTSEPAMAASAREDLLYKGCGATPRQAVTLWVSPGALDSYIQQDGPCCAAASLAGALNLVAGRARDAKKAVTIPAVLKCYTTAAKANARRARLAFEKALGASLEPLILAMEAEAGADVWGRVKKAQLLKLAATCARAALSRPKPALVFQRLRRLQEGKGRKERQWVSWRRDLARVLRFHRAVFRLTQRRPSTGPIGNARILRTARKLGPKGLKATYVMGAGRACGLRVKRGASLRAKAELWRSLAARLVAPRTALIAHVSNHYCLVFAMREWRRGKVVRREVLVATPGQAPNTWLSYRDLRGMMLRWKGHVIMGLTAPK